MHSNPVFAPDFNTGICHFQQQPGAVFQRAAILVITQIGAVLQELVQQITIGTMYMHTVKTGSFGVNGALTVSCDDFFNLVQC